MMERCSEVHIKSQISILIQYFSALLTFLHTDDHQYTTMYFVEFIKTLFFHLNVGLYSEVKLNLINRLP